jgi:hypothetical protein
MNDNRAWMIKATMCKMSSLLMPRAHLFCLLIFARSLEAERKPSGTTCRVERQLSRTCGKIPWSTQVFKFNVNNNWYSRLYRYMGLSHIEAILNYKQNNGSINRKGIKKRITTRESPQVQVDPIKDMRMIIKIEIEITKQPPRFLCEMNSVEPSLRK